ncbi:MAG: EamA family transporter [Candidatus Micrarchaeota archaeon]|nr:EamA family transporter [Candidatus Micrarchaeota archaeon]MDE1847859.1 EamA family transporter [Candidatus Micrarchaeota archaeon]MDE1864186.1 EamA family transporter [Candidatus Micrarchaeota archaeon]
MKITTRAYSYIIISLLTGAMMPIMLVFARSMNIYEFFMFTYLMSMPFALLLPSLTRQPNELRSYLGDPKKLGIAVAVGLLNYVPIGFVILYAEHSVSASLSAVVFRTFPLLMLIFLPAFLKEKLSAKQIIALLLAFAGVYIALSAGSAGGILANPNIYVIALLVASAFAYGFSSILAKKYVFNIGGGIAIFNLAAFLLFSSLFVITGAHFSPISLGAIVAMLFISTANNIIGTYMYYSALRVLKTTLVTNIYFLSPFLTFLFAFLILGEPILPYYLAIAGLVALGLLIQRTDKLGGTYAQGKHAERITIFDITGAFINSEERKIRDAILKGGKVLAIRLELRQKEWVEKAIGMQAHRHVHLYTHLHSAIRSDELTFIREIMGITPKELVLMSAGDSVECESALNEIAASVAQAQ